MSNQALINEAADLIAEYDKDAARAFRFAPSNRKRENIAKAFTAGFRQHDDYSYTLCRFLNVAVRKLLADSNELIGS